MSSSSSRVKQPPSKIIRAPIRRSGDSQVHKEAWDKLSKAIKEIYRKNASNLSFEELYRSAYNLVLQKKGEMLYQGVKEVVSVHLDAMLKERLVPVFPLDSSLSDNSEGGIVFLQEFVKVWDDHTTCLLMLRDILMYMDRLYVTSAQLPVVYDLGLELFRDVVIQSKESPTLMELVHTVLALIATERRGWVVDKTVLRHVLTILNTLQVSRDPLVKETVYDVDFEPVFLSKSRDFYQIESNVLLRECDCAEFLKRVEKRLNEEASRTKHYMIPTTEAKLIRLVEQELIEKNMSAVLEMENSGLVTMLMHDKWDDLDRLYRLFQRVSQGHTEMKTRIAEYIKQVGKSINDQVGGLVHSKSDSNLSSRPSSATQETPSNPLKWVQDMIDLKDKFDTILEKSFAKNKSFQTDINSAIETVMNLNPKCPECKTEQEVDILLDKTIAVFRFIHEKDVFERYYKQHLAKRLIFGKSISEDTEKAVISRLKVECGYQFTTKLEGMFNDMRVSIDTMSAFKEYLEKSITAPKNLPDLHIHVLTSTYWPMNRPVKALQQGADNKSDTMCIFPNEMASCIQQFELFYTKRHSGRRLTWLPNMGTADVKALFPKGKKELNVSTYAMVVLVGVFNKHPQGDAVPFSTIKDETDIPDADLRRTLQSLSLGKHKILIKSSKVKQVLDSDTFSLNLQFTAPLNKIKILTISSSSTNTMETETERSETLEKMDAARRTYAEAAIVRIMKSRKTLSHTLLVQEVIKQLSPRFQPSLVMIKERIEALIEREYLERDLNDRKQYNYLA